MSVEKLKTELRIRKNELEGHISLMERMLKVPIQGFLRISTVNNHTYYFHVKDKGDTNGEKIPSDSPLVKTLACMQYYKKALKEAKEELKLVDALLKKENSNPVAGVYSKLSDGRKNLVTPVEVTMEVLVERWNKSNPLRLQVKEGQWRLKTKRGDFVRSKAEMLIADTLYENGIPYRYDVAFEVDQFHIIWPDFKVLNPRTGEEFLWEHFGMMDKAEYVTKTLEKLGDYSYMGWFPGNGLIVTFDDGKHPLTAAEVKRIVKTLLQ